MVNISIESNLKQVAEQVMGIHDNFQDFVDTVLISLGETGLEQIRSLAPRKSGQYAESWIVQEVTPVSLRLAPNTPDMEFLAIYLERGTSPHTIFPKRGLLLSWIGSDGKRRFARFVRHPGTQPQKHIETAAMLARDFVFAEIPQMVDNLVNLKAGNKVKF